VKFVSLFGLSIMMLVCGGCAVKNPHPVGSFERADFFAEHGHDLEAVSAFESFLRHHPTDDLAAEAQYRKAQEYMALAEFPLAAVEFQILRKDYPTSPLVEGALFREGEAYLFQVGRVERDLTGALEARRHFLNFSQEYPSSSYMPQVVEHMQEISDLVVRKRLGQVKVYHQLAREKAVAKVLDQVIETEGGSTLMPEVLWERGQAAERLDDPDTAVEMYEKLLAQYPDHEFQARAAAALSRLNEPDSEES